MFEKTCKSLSVGKPWANEVTVTDLIRGLRANKKDEQRYIQSAIVECKKEARSQDLDVKAGAILKLTYLAMFGQDMAWASFQTVEVMASSKFLNKRIGYMAASQGFRQDTDVLMLATNLMKKDIGSSNPSEISVALGGLGDIVTPDLARDLSHDLVVMLGHSKATVRKKAVLVMYKVFLQYPEALRSSYPKLRERLEDSDQAVVSATINVIVELSRKNPKNYLPLAPALFELLTTSSNNWMLIKIIKLFATLTPLEPRLVKKLINPLTDLIQSTSAMSLLYECINTVISGDMLSNPNTESLAQLCIHKLRTFFEQDDQNLKYVGLIALTKVMETHPDLVSNHQDVILQCIDDPDVSIRLRALELVCSMPTRKSLPEIVKRLMKQLLPSSDLIISPSYRKDVVLKLLRMCGTDTYKHIESFDWYIAVLIDLVKISKVDVAVQLRDEIRNVCVRVKSVREFAIPTLERLLCNRDIIINAADPDTNAEALASAAWAVGEYSNDLEEPAQTLRNLIASPFEHLSSNTQCSYLQAIPKLYSRWLSEMTNFPAPIRAETVLQTSKVVRTLEKFIIADDIEVQRRSVELTQLFIVAEQCLEATKDDDSGDLPQFFSEILPNLYLAGGDINPVAPSAQARILPPLELDLDKWIIQPTPEASPELAPIEAAELIDEDLDEEARIEQRRARNARNKDDPFYIQADSPLLDAHEKSQTFGEVDVDAIPVILLDNEPSKVRRKKRKPRIAEPVEILTDEMPEGLPVESGRLSPTMPTVHKSHINGGGSHNVLRVDGSKLTAFDLDAANEEEQTTFEAYEVISAAKIATQKSKVDRVAVAKKKKRQKKTKQLEDSSSPILVEELENSTSKATTALNASADVVEVIKNKKKKVKQIVDL